MKRMIVCEKCAWRSVPSYEGEWFKRVHGTAKRDMFCDWCSPQTEILKGDECAAESIGRSDGPAPYYPWEHEFINREGMYVPKKRSS